KLLVSAGERGIVIWDVESGKEIRFIPVGGGTVLSMALSPDGKILALGTHFGAVGLFDFPNGKELRPLGTLAGRIGDVAFVEEGKKIAAASDYMEAGLWESDTRRLVLTSKKLYTAARVGINPQKPEVHFSDSDKSLYRWSFLTDKKKFEKVRVFDGRPGVHLIRKDFSIVSGGGKLFVGDSAAGKEVSFDFRADSLVRNKEIFACAHYESGLIGIFQVAPTKELKRANHDLGWIEALALSPSNKYLASASRFGTICIWNWRTGERKLYARPYGRNYANFLFPDKKRLMLPAENKLLVADIATQRQAAVADLDQAIWYLAPDGDHVIGLTCTSVTHFRLSNKQKKTVEVRCYQGAVGVATKGTGFAVVASFCPMSFWDFFAAQPRLLAQSPSDLSGVATAGAFSPDGKMFIAGSMTGVYKVLDAATGKEVFSGRLTKGMVSETSHPIYALAFGSSADRFFAATFGGVYAVELKTGKLLHEFSNVLNRPAVMAVSTRGDLLAVGQTKEPKIMIWDTASAKSLAVIEGHKAGIAFLAFSPDGQHLASLSRDHTILLWD